VQIEWCALIKAIVKHSKVLLLNLMLWYKWVSTFLWRCIFFPQCFRIPDLDNTVMGINSKPVTGIGVNRLVWTCFSAAKHVIVGQFTAWSSTCKGGAMIISTDKYQIPLHLFCRRPGLRPGPRLSFEQIICRRPVTNLSETCFKPDANFLIDAAEPTYFCNLFQFLA